MIHLARQTLTADIAEILVYIAEHYSISSGQNKMNYIRAYGRYKSAMAKTLKKKRNKQLSAWPGAKSAIKIVQRQRRYLREQKATP